jgi:hypothetical protein
MTSKKSLRIFACRKGSREPSRWGEPQSPFWRTERARQRQRQPERSPEGRPFGAGLGRREAQPAGPLSPASAYVPFGGGAGVDMWYYGRYCLVLAGLRFSAVPRSPPVKADNRSGDCSGGHGVIKVSEKLHSWKGADPFEPALGSRPLNSTSGRILAAPRCRG